MSLLSLAALAAATVVTVDAPVTSVTVFSDRARVTRSASVPVQGTQRLELPLLLDSVDVSSIRVEASGATVQRVDIAHVDAGEFPATEARALLDKITKLDDQLSRVLGDRQAASTLHDFLSRLQPITPSGDPLKPVPRLNPVGWGAILQFVATWSERLQTRIRDLGEKLADLGRERAELADKARLIGGAGRRSGQRVSATVAGNGNARLTLTYMTEQARWYPAYDIQLLPDRGQVLLSFAGQVSQETGEDWSDAALVLSTAVPATAVEMPRLLTWRIGERERFIPSVRPAPDTVRPPPRAVPPLLSGRDDDLLRQRLLGLASSSPSGYTGEGKNADYGGRGAYPTTPKPPSGYAPKGRGDTIDGLLTRSRSKPAEEKEGMAEEDTVAPPPPPADPMPSMAPASPAPEMAASESVAYKKSSARSAWTPPAPTMQVGLAPPPGYRAPSYDSRLPVALAGGYDLAFPSLRKETVKSGAGPRRVALFSESWPVSVDRKLFAALAPEAYLVAEIRNPSKKVLPGGEASLFVGADPAGTAHLNVVAPGESFTLPLGLDRAIKPVRNVKLVLTEKGVFSKDELSEYTVTIEVANPYRAPIGVRLVDQWPVTTDKNVELKLLRTDPPAQADPHTGKLEWKLTLPAGGKTVVTFVYTLRRPKGWRVHQWQ